MADSASAPRSGSAVVPFWKQRTFKRVAVWLGPPLVSIVLFVALVLMAPRFTNHLVQPDSEEVQGLQLKTLIREVKKELQDADQEAIKRGEVPLFDLKEFDLDVNIVASGKNAEDAQVLAVGSNVEVSRERVQHIHLVWNAASPLVVLPEPGHVTGKTTDVIDAEPVQTGGPNK